MTTNSFLHFSILKICVHLPPKKFGVGAGLKPARTEFGVKGDKALFLILGNSLSAFICALFQFFFRWFK
jgi:hypothetical protein